MIQDTSFVIDVLNGAADALDVLELIERENRPEKISAITSLELYEGVRRPDKPDEGKRQVPDVLDTKHVIPADHAVMKLAGDLGGRLVTNGDRIDREDCIIAATAMEEHETVLKRDEPTSSGFRTSRFRCTSADRRLRR